MPIYSGQNVKVLLNGVEISERQPTTLTLTVSDEAQESTSLHTRTPKHVGGLKKIELTLEQARLNWDLYGYSIGRHRIHSGKAVPFIEILDYDGQFSELTVNQWGATGTYCLTDDGTKHYRAAQRFKAMGDEVRWVKAKLTGTATSAQSYECYIFNATYNVYDFEAGPPAAASYYDVYSGYTVGQQFVTPYSQGGWLDRVRIYLNNTHTDTDSSLRAELFKWNTTYQTTIDGPCLARGALVEGDYDTGAFYAITFDNPATALTQGATYLIHISSGASAAKKYLVGYTASGGFTGYGYSNKTETGGYDLCMYVEYAIRDTYAGGGTYSFTSNPSARWCTFDFSVASQSATGICTVTYGGIYFLEFATSAGAASTSYHQIHRNTYTNNFLGGFGLRSSYRDGDPSTYWIYQTYDLAFEIGFGLDDQLIVEVTTEDWDNWEKLVETYSGILVNNIDFEHAPGEMIIDTLTGVATNMGAIRKGL